MSYSKYFFKRNRLILFCIKSIVCLFSNLIAFFLSIIGNFHFLIPTLFSILSLYFVIEAIVNIKKTTLFIRKWKEKERKEEEARKACPYKIEGDGSYGKEND